MLQKKCKELILTIYYTECKEIFSGAGNGLIEASFEWMHITFARNKSSISDILFTVICRNHFFCLDVNVKIL